MTPIEDFWRKGRKGHGLPVCGVAGDGVGWPWAGQNGQGQEPLWVLARLDLVAQTVKFLTNVVRHLCWLSGKVPLYAVKT